MPSSLEDVGQQPGGPVLRDFLSRSFDSSGKLNGAGMLDQRQQAEKLVEFYDRGIATNTGLNPSSGHAKFHLIGLRAGMVVRGGCFFAVNVGTTVTLTKIGLYSTTGKFFRATPDLTSLLVANDIVKGTFADVPVPADDLYYLVYLSVWSGAAAAVAGYLAPNANMHSKSINGGPARFVNVTGNADLNGDIVLNNTASTGGMWIAALLA